MQIPVAEVADYAVNVKSGCLGYLGALLLCLIGAIVRPPRPSPPPAGFSLRRALNRCCFAQVAYDWDCSTKPKHDAKTE